MPNPDLKQQLAECVARTWFETQTTVGDMGVRWETTPQQIRDNTVASLLPITEALLSLPGIAIVDTTALALELSQLAENHTEASCRPGINELGQMYHLGKAEGFREAAVIVAACCGGRP